MRLANDLPVPIPEAAEQYGIDVRRLRGAVWRENLEGDLALPVGSFEADVVYDDERLHAWVAKQRKTN